MFIKLEPKKLSRFDKKITECFLKKIIKFKIQTSHTAKKSYTS